MHNGQKDRQHRAVGVTAASGLNNSTLAASGGLGSEENKQPHNLEAELEAGASALSKGKL